MHLYGRAGQIHNERLSCNNAGGMLSECVLDSGILYIISRSIAGLTGAFASCKACLCLVILLLGAKRTKYIEELHMYLYLAGALSVDYLNPM